MSELLINIDVEDLELAVAFYCTAFGLQVARRFGAAGVELLGAKAPIYLLRKAAESAPFPGATGGRSYQRHWTPMHLDFVVADISLATRRAEQAGARRESEIQTQPYGFICLMSDPFGNGFCLLQFAGPGYDAITTSFG